MVLGGVGEKLSILRALKDTTQDDEVMKRPGYLAASRSWNSQLNLGRARRLEQQL